MKIGKNSEVFSTDGEGVPVTVDDRAWLSTRTIVLPGCHISECAVVTAGEVVTKSLNEPFVIYSGIPDKKIGNRNKNLNHILKKIATGIFSEKLEAVEC